MLLPAARGEITELLFEELKTNPHPLGDVPIVSQDPLTGEDLQLALFCCYELHYQGFDDVNDAWEWEPSLIAIRRRMESAFESSLTAEVPRRVVPPGGMAERLQRMIDEDPAPSLSRFVANRATADQFVEFVQHRSIYHLKEADPHSWAIPRITGAPKAALVEIQSDEYGSGSGARMHSVLFANVMDALGLDSSYGAYLDDVPAITLATVNLMSMFGLNRRLRGAAVGHLAVFEMTSSLPNRRYAAGLRRLGLAAAAPFYDEHVEADSVHEAIASHDLAGGLATAEPDLAADIVFGAEALLFLDGLWAAHLLDAWQAGATSLRAPASVATA